MKEGSIEMTAFIIMKMFDTQDYPKRSALDFVLRVYKQSSDAMYQEHLKAVFWHIIDNHVDNIETLNRNNN